MAEENVTHLQDEMDFPYWYDVNGEVPIWDDPTMRGYRKHPTNYKPALTIEGSLSLEKRRFIDEKDVYLMKVLGDAICPNENQLRRYMSKKMSPSETSKRLKKFRTFGIAERWYVQSDIRDDEHRPPAPFTLGIAGYKYLKHYYNEFFFMDPDRWNRFGVKGVQRYVSINEIRCQLAERRKLSGWKWQGVIANNPHLYRVMGVAEVLSPKGKISLAIERAQMGVDYENHLLSRLERWKHPYEKFGHLPIRDINADHTVVVIYTSTRSFMKHIFEKIPFFTYQFPIWFCCEEDLKADGIDKAFFMPKEKSLKRLKLDFLE